MLQPSGTYIRLYDWTVNTELSWLDSMAVASVRSNMRHGRTSTRRLFLILRNNSHQWQPSARCSLWITIRKRVYWYITLEAIWYHATVVIAVPTKVILSLHAHCTGFRATLNYYIIFLVPHMKMCNFIFGLVVYLFSFFFSFLLSPFCVAAIYILYWDNFCFDKFSSKNAYAFIQFTGSLPLIRWITGTLPPFTTAFHTFCTAFNS